MGSIMDRSKWVRLDCCACGRVIMGKWGKIEDSGWYVFMRGMGYSIHMGFDKHIANCVTGVACPDHIDVVRERVRIASEWLIRSQFLKGEEELK